MSQIAWGTRKSEKCPVVSYIDLTEKPSEFLFSLQTVEQRLPIGHVKPDIPTFNRPLLERTETEVMTKSRLGQGRFRKDVIRLWGSCAVTGFQTITVLKASHIKPWNSSSNQERLDPYNGFLLLPNFDTLFDLGLISFQDNGEILVSGQVTEEERHILSIQRDSKLRWIYPENALYLKHHRDELFIE